MQVDMKWFSAHLVAIAVIGGLTFAGIITAAVAGPAIMGLIGLMLPSKVLKSN